MKHKELIEKMTLAEKCSLTTGKNMFQTRDIERLGIASIWLADGPHGLRKQEGSADNLGLNPSLPATCFPTASMLANSWDEELLEEIGKALGDEAAALGVSVILGPGLNIKRSPLCGRNFEYFSEDPLLSGKMAAAMVRGIQSRGVAACPKHFAANSQELLRMSSDSIVDERTLREIYLTAFEIAVKESKPKTIMSSYNKINGYYAHEHYWLLTDVLRGEWGFDGVVISDWGGVNDAVLSARNGGTLEMPGGGFDSARQLLSAVQSGELDEETLNKRVDEAIELAFNTKPESGKTADFNAHHLLARKAAERGTVLLKNDGNILPLKSATRVAVIGEFARSPRFQGAGSSQINAVKVDAALDLIKESGLDFKGFADASSTDEALALAKNADVILFYLGLDAISETEGVDRTHINLPEKQTVLLGKLSETGKPVVAVVTAGSVIDMGWTAKAQAVVHGFLHGEAGAGAVIDILTGKVNPSGKLAETYPVKLEDTPVYGNYPSPNLTAEYREGLYVGYRYYETANIPVAYPFGYGLSFSTFMYSGLTVDAQGAEFTISNNGGMDGAEIAQMYVKLTNSNAYRPSMELKGFKRITLKAGESACIRIPFNDRTFRYFNAKTKRWETEKGDYEILIGANVRDIRLTGAIKIDGIVADNYRETLPSYYGGNIRNVSDREFAALLGRELPPHGWLENGRFVANNALRQMHESKSFLLRLVAWVIHGRINTAEKKGKPDLNAVFLYNMPIRAFARNAGMFFSMEMVDGIIEMANGHFLKGFGRVIGGFFRNRKLNRQCERQLLEGKTSNG
uniref:Beta-glucosidase n=1 Tax=uncultured bacterium contig00019 TaxID=1181510 RepID=A0A806KIK5_9BACT|nr:beta-glucosidase [uncultured bacterium contig00019]